jgi:hypothetical protein
MLIVRFLRARARVVKWQTRTFEGRMPKGMGVQVPPRAEEIIGRAAVCSGFCDFLIDFGPEIGIPALMPRKLTIGKTSKISIFQRKAGRWIVNWYDEHGARRNPSFATLKEAEAFQKQKRAELERHRGGRFNLDDREMLSRFSVQSRIHRPTGCSGVAQFEML